MGEAKKEKVTKQLNRIAWMLIGVVFTSYAMFNWVFPIIGIEKEFNYYYSCIALGVSITLIVMPNEWIKSIIERVSNMLIKNKTK